MNNARQKGLKPFVIRVLAVAMSLYYLLAPMHNELSKVLHIVAHQLEMPDNLLEHSNSKYFNYLSHDSHEIIMVSKEPHHHPFLDLINTIVEATNMDNDAEHSNLPSYKIDKHIKTIENLKKPNSIICIEVQHEFPNAIKHFKSNFLHRDLKPPQLHNIFV